MSRSLGLDSRVEPCSGWGLGSGLKMLWMLMRPKQSWACWAPYTGDSKSYSSFGISVLDAKCIHIYMYILIYSV